MIDRPLPDSNAEIAALMGHQLGVGGGDTLKDKMAKGGRRLPHTQRQQGAYLVQQEDLWAHPKTRRVIDGKRVSKTQSELRRYLQQLDLRDIFIGRVIGVLAPLMLNILLIFIALVTWLVMTGRV